MKPKFHDSLPSLLALLHAAGICVDKDIVVVRDGVGRLIVAKSDGFGESKELALKIKSELGAYAAPIPLVYGEVAERLKSDDKLTVVTISTAAGDFTVKYVDRRIVGADWLTAPAPASDKVRRLVFASLKGGVGRSTALSVLAADLVRTGLRVLAVDLDIEAPGIGFMLLPTALNVGDDRRPKYGVIDYLLENGLNGVEDDELSDFVGVSSFGNGYIDVIPAVGRVTDDFPESMISKLSRALVEDVRDNNVFGLSSQISEMIDRFSRYKDYDVILIDARAGMSEVSASPILSLGAEVLLFATDQPQTFRGYRYLLSHVMAHFSTSDVEAWSSWRERLTFVQAKATASAIKRRKFRESLYNLCSEFLYNSEILGADGEVISGGLGPAPTEVGIGIPHDATYVAFHPDYDAFDPLGDETQLDADVYDGPFGPFLKRARAILGLAPTEDS